MAACSTTRKNSKLSWTSMCSPKGGSRRLEVGGNARDPLTDDQTVDVVRAFVRVDGFEVVHVAHDAVVVHDTIGAQDVAGLPRGLESHPDIVHLEHRDLREVGAATVFESTDVKRQGLALADLGDHPHQLILDKLMRGDGAIFEVIT